jgi:hypothetical protein
VIARSGKKPDELELYDSVPDDPALVLLRWHEIRGRICVAIERAKAEDERVALLQFYSATMDIVEDAAATMDPQTVPEIRETRLKDYDGFIVQECLEGQALRAERLAAVSRREIAAGRMAPEAELLKRAQAALEASDDERSELLGSLAERHAPRRRGTLERVLTFLRLR